MSTQRKRTRATNETNEKTNAREFMPRKEKGFQAGVPGTWYGRHPRRIILCIAAYSWTSTRCDDCARVARHYNGFKLRVCIEISVCGRAPVMASRSKNPPLYIQSRYRICTGYSLFLHAQCGI